MAVMNGNEHFSANGREIDLTMADFWKWAYSDLSSHLQRAILSEYIVASALNTTEKKCSRSSKAKISYDLLTEDGFRIAIKSAAYMQSPEAEHPDCISFSIMSPLGQNCRCSDIYIFCLYKGMTENDSPLNLDLWEFFVIKSSVLDEKKPTQKTITLPSLMRLQPLWCDYYGISEAIQTTMNA